MKQAKTWGLVLALLALLPALSFAQDETTTRMARVPSSPGTDNGGRIQTPPSPPSPVSPPPGSKGGSIEPVMVVLHPNALLYEFVVYPEEGNEPAARALVTEPFWAASGPGRGLPYGTYSWTCRVYDGICWSAFFEPRWSFTIVKSVTPGDILPAPIPCQPPCGTKGVRLVPELEVVAPIGTVVLHFRVMNGDGSGIVTEGITSESRWRVATVGSELPYGVYNWTCRAFDGQEWSNWFEPPWTFEVTKPDDVADGLMGERKVRQADDSRFTPNPSDGSQRLRLYLERAGHLEAAVYSPEGRLVRTIFSSRTDAGEHELVWDGLDEHGNRVGAGTYLCRIRTGGFTSTVKVTRSR